MSDTDYDRIAPLYDPLLDPLLRGLRRRVARALAGRGVKTVLDLCCGTGRQAAALVRAGMEATGVDLSEGMLAQARAKSPAGAVFLEADATAVPLPDGSFDAVCICLALHEMEEPARMSVLAEARRLTREQGLVCVADYRAPTTLAGRLFSGPVAVVERLAGREHHRHYRDYMTRGATRGVMARAGLSAGRSATALTGCVGVYLAESGQ